MLARNGERLATLEQEIANAKGYVCDVTDEAQLDTVIAAIEAELGTPLVLIHNAVGGAFSTFLEIDPQVLNRNFQVNTMALLYLARRLAPAMVAAGKGAIIASGNTAALRGEANFAGFAPTKAMHQLHVDDPALIADAVAYVTELRDEVEEETGPTKPGAGRAVPEMVLADPMLCAYVRRWARQRQSCEAKIGRVLHLPIDPVYQQLRGALIQER